MAELTIEVVREWLAENKATEGVQAFLKELGTADPQLSAEAVMPWLETEDGKKALEPIIDRERTRAVKTHDAKVKDQAEAEVKRRVAEELLRANPQETPEQKQIRELREEITKERTTRERDALKRAIVEEAARQQVPSWWVDEYSGSTLEEAKVFLGRVKKHDDEIVTRAKNELLATGYKPGSGNGQNGAKKVDPFKVPFDEAVKLEMEGKLNEAL